MKFGSLFSGCGGLDSGLQDADLECAWRVEIDPKRQAVLRYHDPVTPIFGDIRDVRAEQLESVSLIAAGSPCQGLSTAGHHKGLDDERSGLFYQFVRIADSQASAWMLWENVNGAMWSPPGNNGEDFAVVLREITGFWPAVPREGWASGGICVGIKRWACWRVLDSAGFGVAQERRRVFLVAGPRNGRHRPEVLLERDSTSRSSEEEREFQSSAAIAIHGNIIGRNDSRVGGSLLKNDRCFTLTKTDIHGVIVGNIPRRMLPVEYERLQGYPDNFTRYGRRVDGEIIEFSDSVRYEMVGDGVTKTVARWIGNRILRAHRGEEQDS